MPAIDWSELPNSIKAAIIGAVGACATVIVLLVTGVPSPEPTAPDGGGPDGGLPGNCAARKYTCTAYTKPESKFKPDGGPPYVALMAIGQKCAQADGGFFKVLPTYENEVYVDENFCVEGNPQAGDETALPRADPIGVDNHGCACKKDRFCSIILPNDGGVKTAPWGETLPYQGFQGADCYPKVCVEIAGISSWPDQCPVTKPPGAED